MKLVKEREGEETVSMSNSSACCSSSSSPGGGDGGGVGGGDVVMVGVKFDAPSRQLLTWSLMKIAQPGDRVIALHVLPPDTNYSSSAAAADTSSLLSLVKTFDSLLSVYEGFCSLKQVDLKLKVCKGASVKKILVREAKASGASKLIVGTSNAHHTIRSSTSVAKYCARKLPCNFSVFALKNSRIVFQKEGSRNGCVNCPLKGGGGGDDKSLALQPVTGSLENNNSRRGWFLLRRAFLRHRNLERSKVKRVNVVYPDGKLTARDVSFVGEEDKVCPVDLDAQSGAIVPVGPPVEWCPVSPRREPGGVPAELEGLVEKYSSSCRLFTYEELVTATNDFDSDNVVGKGGTSIVYKGCLPDGKELAVKVLKPSEDVLKQFVSEIEIITTLHHKNIISLLGFCFDCGKLLLVYDFLSRGSLEENLHGNKKNLKAFGWRERYKVAVGVGEALCYLHNGCEQPVIHMDVKSSNILLSDDFEPQLSDFGLANWLSASSHTTRTDVAGTFGYLAPEYFMHGKVSDKVDVFAFGVVLLELLCGKMPINNENPKGKESLVMWAMPILEGGKASQLLDPHLEADYDDNQIERMILAATLCIRRSPKLRPQISLVLKLLQGDEEVTTWARNQVSESEQNDDVDGDAFPTNIQSHLNLALLDLEDDSLSITSTEQGVSIDDYLQGRWSRTSSFD
ncbi:hypothetical protein Tsubulata_043159 [Turnera subulata]|uniref:Protein kinase domain-containing protein n=1 Tax=Turnera subulata TaxID=218843 RepID=A0A9Q0FZF7_9ROSI|nr:hypothetical protein Tsubulata_043159 [Turnera subulata]